MGGALLQIAALFVATYSFITAAGLFGSIVSLRGEEIGLSTTAIGLTGSAYFAGFLAGCILSPWFIRRSGHIRTFATGGALAAITPLWLLAWVDPISWGCARLVGGLAVAMIYTTVESWVNDSAENQFRGRLVSLYVMVTQFANFSGQGLVLLKDSEGVKIFYLITVLFLLSVLPVAQTRSPNPSAPLTIKPDIKGLWRNSPVSFATAMLNGAANSAMWIVCPLYIARIYSAEAVGILMPCYLLGGLMSQWPLGRYSDKTDRRKIMLISGTLAVMGATYLIFFGQNGQISAAFGLWLLGSGVLSSYGLASAHANDRSKPGESVQLAGAMLVLYAICAVIGPTLASAIIALIGDWGLFLYMGAIHAAWTLFTLWRIYRRTPTKEQAAPYAYTAQTGPVVGADLAPAMDMAESAPARAIQPLPHPEEKDDRSDDEGEG